MTMTMIDRVANLFTKPGVVLTSGEVAKKVKASSTGAAVHALNALVEYGDIAVNTKASPKEYRSKGRVKK